MDELEAAPPAQNTNDDEVYHQESLERERLKERDEQASLPNQRTLAQHQHQPDENHALYQNIQKGFEAT